MGLILYAHFIDFLSRAPLNTQSPHAECDIVSGSTLPTVQTHTGTEADIHFERHRYTMFSSPGLVEYFGGCDGARIHNEPGLADDLEIAGDTIYAYWYLSAAPAPGPLGNFPVADVAPQVAVKARMETGRHPGQGTLIAAGDTGQCDLGPAPTCADRVTLVSAPGQNAVYEVRVPMAVHHATIPSVHSGAQGFVVTIEPYQISGDLATFTQADVRSHSSPDFPPRLVLDVMRPMRTDSLELNDLDGGVYLTWDYVPALGSYDTSFARLDARLVRPGQGAVPDAWKLVSLERSVDHDGHFNPIRATWALDVGAAALPDGTYRVDVRDQNLQETYELRDRLWVEVSEGELSWH